MMIVTLFSLVVQYRSELSNHRMLTRNAKSQTRAHVFLV